MATRMLQRRGTAAEWAAENPVLADGELGFETDTKIIKLGDGLTPWNALTMPYMMTGGATMTGPLSVIAPSDPSHPARLLDLNDAVTSLGDDIDAVASVADAADARSWKDLREWTASNRGTGTSEGSYQPHGGALTIPNPGRTVYVQVMQNFYISKGPAVGGGIEIAWLSQISFDGGSSWTSGGQPTTLIANNDRNSGGGGTTFHHRQGTPSGDIIARFLSKRVDSNSGTVNANAVGGYVRVEAI